VLHHLNTFLTLKEMALTARTQKEWLAAAASAKPHVAQPESKFSKSNSFRSVTSGSWTPSSSRRCVTRSSTSTCGVTR
jgi:hypothetical protein